jgi:hypothetical protein
LYQKQKNSQNQQCYAIIIVWHHIIEELRFFTLSIGKDKRGDSLFLVKEKQDEKFSNIL